MLLLKKDDDIGKTAEENMTNTLLKDGIVQQAVIVVTLEARGAMILSHNGDNYEKRRQIHHQSYICQHFNNKPIVDTNGAGYSFRGSL